MGCGCAARRAKMKAWVKKQQEKRIAAKKAKAEEKKKQDEMESPDVQNDE